MNDEGYIGTWPAYDENGNIFPYGKIGDWDDGDFTYRDTSRDDDYRLLENMATEGDDGDKRWTSMNAREDQYGDPDFSGYQSDDSMNTSFFDDGLLPGTFDEDTGLPIPNTNNIFVNETQGTNIPHNFIPGASYQYRIRVVNFTQTLMDSNFNDVSDGIIDINPDNQNQDRNGAERPWIEEIDGEALIATVNGSFTISEIPDAPSGTPPANPSWEAGTIWVDDDGNTWQYVWFTWAQVGGIGDGLTTPPQYGWLFISFGGG
jgi:hypothetical protein